MARVGAWTARGALESLKTRENAALRAVEGPAPGRSATSGNLSEHARNFEASVVGANLPVVR